MGRHGSGGQGSHRGGHRSSGHRPSQSGHNDGGYGDGGYGDGGHGDGGYGRDGYDNSGYAAERRDDRGYDDRSYAGSRIGGDARPRLGGPLLWLGALAGLVIWSLIAWAAYLAVGPILTWVASSAGLLVDTGKSIASLTEAGKVAGNVLDGLNVTGLAGQAIVLMQAVAGPVIVVVWALGALALLAAPLILPRAGRLIGRRH
ncbi:MAG: hypothetical protein V4712_04390 [Pseudomonadota bacterium]